MYLDYEVHLSIRSDNRKDDSCHAVVDKEKKFVLDLKSAKIWKFSVSLEKYGYI
jgi:hypothetical protein